MGSVVDRVECVESLVDVAPWTMYNPSEMDILRVNTAKIALIG